MGWLTFGFLLGALFSLAVFALAFLYLGDWRLR